MAYQKMAFVTWLFGASSSDILTEDVENGDPISGAAGIAGAAGARRQRRSRPTSAHSTAAAGGREREFTGGGSAAAMLQQNGAADSGRETTGWGNYFI